MHRWRYSCARLQSTALVAVLLTAVFVACSGDSTVAPEDPGNLPPSAGEGSGTLRVVAEVEGRDTGSGFETDFFASVLDSVGGPVSARVVITGRVGVVELTEESPGSYRAVRSGYETGSYTLDVTGAEGSVTGVTVIAPDVHAITSPTSGEIVAADVALNVRWTRASTSSECRLETLDYDSDWIYGDPGTLWAPSIGNPPRTDQRIRILRRNVREPAGGLSGSRFSVRIRCTVEPVVAQ